ncbi:MAG: DUF1302 family protein [Gammaproteobacteria bacterium]|nr:DUF1302 family protein [Gammaproteobacteria bacterium]
MSRDFRFAGADGILDTTLSYGLMVRLEDRDPGLIAISSGGSASNANGDDGNLNYDKGIVSNMVRAHTQMAMTWGRVGLYVNGSAFYDYENDRNDRKRTDLSSRTKDSIGKGAEVRESYLSARFLLKGMPIQIRAGDQIINWGETSFIRGGVGVINALDLVSVLQPASRPQDFRIPQGMVWGAANLTENFALEAYYQYEWERSDFPPVGSYFSPIDLIGAAGLGGAMLGAGRISDLGTDLDAHFALPDGTLGFDPDFLRIPGGERDDAKDGGQYGVALVVVTPSANALKLGLHYIRYHSRLPLLEGRTADAQAVARTSSAAVAARAAGLAPIYEAQGLSPAEAAAAALAASQDLTLSEYANQARYFAVYPEDIDVIGVTFNTATVGTGTLFSGEISHHFDFPFQVAVEPVLNATLSPVLFDPAIGSGVLGDFGPDEVVPGVQRLDRTQSTLEIAQLFTRRLGADQIVVSADVAWSRVHDITDADVVPLQGAGAADANSFGYRLTAVARYSGILGAVNLIPRIIFTHDFKGTTPAPVSTFLEDRKTVSIGVGASYINKVTFDLSYTAFFGAGRRDGLNDRDFLRVQLTYSF